jgi:hypothetical protein
MEGTVPVGGCRYQVGAVGTRWGLYQVVGCTRWGLYLVGDVPGGGLYLMGGLYQVGGCTRAKFLSYQSEIFVDWQ